MLRILDHSAFELLMNNNGSVKAVKEKCSHPHPCAKQTLRVSKARPIVMN